jgi:hypothetical protein
MKSNGEIVLNDIEAVRQEGKVVTDDLGTFERACFFEEIAISGKTRAFQTELCVVDQQNEMSVSEQLNEVHTWPN